MPKLYFTFSLEKGGGLPPEGVFAAVDLNNDKQAQKLESFDLKQKGLTWTGTKEFASPTKVGGLVVMVSFRARPGVKFEVKVHKDGPDGPVLAEGKDTVADADLDARFLYLREVGS